MRSFADGELTENHMIIQPLKGLRPGDSLHVSDDNQILWIKMGSSGDTAPESCHPPIHSPPPARRRHSDTP